ncbi:hypothetical protein [Desulfatibacillum aliphaticivorans]|uniref:hypothetical protein n=1 Tax=Desulfatibacillum aliphaticivorans TaxID=218208 RepID=UPI0003F5A99C|nr:hypothetical protein [Desulfatibacillum aliphaticivorans]
MTKSITSCRATKKCFNCFVFLFILLTWIFPTCGFSKEMDPPRYGKNAFYSFPVGTVAFLPGIIDEADAKEFIQFCILPESGAYQLQKQVEYWFVVNHHLPRETGTFSYIGVSALSFLDRNVKKLDQPVSMFRNAGWSRLDDANFSNNNERRVGSEISPRDFFAFHKETKNLFDQDRQLGHPWHGNFTKTHSSFSERTYWDLGSILYGDLSTYGFDNEIFQNACTRVDGKLLRFQFTSKKNSNNPLIFRLNGTNRTGSYLKLFSPDHYNDFYRTFSLTYTED